MEPQKSLAGGRKGEEVTQNAVKGMGSKWLNFYGLPLCKAANTANGRKVTQKHIHVDIQTRKITQTANTQTKRNTQTTQRDSRQTRRNRLHSHTIQRDSRQT